MLPPLPHDPLVMLAASVDALSNHIGLLLVVGAGVGFYAAARAVVDALGGAEPSAGVLAAAHGVPIALVAAVAALMGLPEVAVAVAFASSVAVLSLVLGLVALNDVGPRDQPPPTSARAWPFLVPAALLAFVAGFSGRLTPLHALLLAVQGVAIAAVWRGERSAVAPPHDVLIDPATDPMTGAEPPPLAERAPVRRLDGFRLAELGFAVVLGLLGAWAAVNGAVRMSHEQAIMTPTLVGASVVAPLLVLPMVGAGTLLARLGRARAATTAIVAIVLLNVCAVLPLVVALSVARPAFASALGPLAAVLDPPAPPPPPVYVADDESAVEATTIPAVETTTAPTTQPAPDEPVRHWTDGVPYPMAVWRLDTVVLIVLCLVILPVALGRWTLGRRDGLVLVIVYAVYLALTALFGRRW